MKLAEFCHALSNAVGFRDLRMWVSRSAVPFPGYLWVAPPFPFCSIEVDVDYLLSLDLAGHT